MSELELWELFDEEDVIFDSIDPESGGEIYTKESSAKGPAQEAARIIFQSLDEETPIVYWDRNIGKAVSYGPEGAQNPLEFVEDNSPSLINYDSFLDAIAMKTLVCDRDIHGSHFERDPPFWGWENIQVTEEGTVYPIDFGNLGKLTEGVIKHNVIQAYRFLDHYSPDEVHLEEVNEEVRNRTMEYVDQLDVEAVETEIRDVFEEEGWRMSEKYDRRLLPHIEYLDEGEWADLSEIRDYYQRRINSSGSTTKSCTSGNNEYV